ncbi:MAG TPA: hypothetical protein VHW00_12610 [Thermoanaerobaculia bacterium]|nr:hypothetical protein [Thermoanaerobaculia bacterium]
MRSLVPVHILASVLSAFLVPFAAAQEPMCGTSADHDRYLEALHARPRGGVSALAQNTSMLRDGAFYLPADELILPGYHRFDLEGTSLVFEPLPSGYAMRRETAPPILSAPALRDFDQTQPDDAWFVAYDLPFAFPIFGRNVTRIYITKFNEIRFDPPVAQTNAVQFGAAEVAATPEPVVSPLVLTTSKPRLVVNPEVSVEATANSVRVQWVSATPVEVDAEETLRRRVEYVVQAELRGDGTIVLAYPAASPLLWGAPLISAGTIGRNPIAGLADPIDVISTSVPVELRPMLDITGVETNRINDADVFSIRATLAATPDVTKLGEGESFRFLFVAEDDSGYVDIDASGVVVTGFGAPKGVASAISAKLVNNTIELFGLQRDAGSSSIVSVRVLSFLRPRPVVIDATGTLQMRLDAAPKRTSLDLSAVANGTELTLPIAETFELAPLDVNAVWDRLQYEQKLSDYDVDGVAIYQSFYTDIIFYAGAYSTRGNPAVDGIAPGQPPFRQRDPRFPALLHMNQLTYNYSAAPETASKVLLHEFGHRWLYFISIAEDGVATRSLNPVSSHPAAYVHTPSAFPVYGENESSVMGGAYFAQQGDGAYRAHAANMGYSWTDLYLMGLAAPGEVPNWFYLAGTTLPLEYWPAEGAVVTNPARKEVGIEQVLAAQGSRFPSHELGQRKFRLLFVLVTEPGTNPTPAEIAKMNEWRALVERNFALATGGRGKLATEFVRPAKTRAAR